MVRPIVRLLLDATIRQEERLRQRSSRNAAEQLSRADRPIAHPQPSGPDQHQHHFAGRLAEMVVAAYLPAGSCYHGVTA